MDYLIRIPTPLGDMTAASDGTALIGLWFQGQKYFSAGLAEAPAENPEDPVLQAAKVWLERYFLGERPDPGSIPLAPRGTAFQMAVWNSLRQIPYGQTSTYGQIAAKLGKGSPRCVGGAVGKNPISILIPCHRVLGADNRLTGYAGGIEKKIALLNIEGIVYQ